MYQINITLGDAIFVVTDDSIKLKSSNKWETTPHFHADYEIHVVLSGNATVEIDGEDVQINQGEACLLAPNLSHYPKESSGDLIKTDFSFSINKNYNYYKTGKTFSEFVYYDNVFKSVKNYTLICNAELIKNIKEILSLENSERNEHVLNTYFSSFFINFAKGIKDKYLLTDSQIISDYHENKNSFNQRKIVEEFFQKRYNEQISIDDLAKDLCLSIPQTHRVVKKIFNVVFKKTLMKQRMSHDCMLIKSGKVKINDLSELCGYDSYNGFLSAFKSHTGKTPKEYEKSLR